MAGSKKRKLNPPSSAHHTTANIERQSKRQQRRSVADPPQLAQVAPHARRSRPSLDCISNGMILMELGVRSRVPYCVRDATRTEILYEYANRLGFLEEAGPFGPRVDPARPYALGLKGAHLMVLHNELQRRELNSFDTRFYTSRELWEELQARFDADELF